MAAVIPGKALIFQVRNSLVFLRLQSKQLRIRAHFLVFKPSLKLVSSFQLLITFIIQPHNSEFKFSGHTWMPFIRTEESLDFPTNLKQQHSLTTSKILFKSCHFSTFSLFFLQVSVGYNGRLLPLAFWQKGITSNSQVYFIKPYSMFRTLCKHSLLVYQAHTTVKKCSMALLKAKDSIWNPHLHPHLSFAQASGLLPFNNCMPTKQSQTATPAPHCSLNHSTVKMASVEYLSHGARCLLPREEKKHCLANIRGVNA